jgi:hypothetical protein
MVNQVYGPQGASDKLTAKDDRRYTLLERADLDPNTNNDEYLLSSGEYKQIIANKPEQFLREVRELIK